MTGKAMMAKLHQMLKDARAEQATHKRQWGQCLSTCETVQRISVIIDIIKALGGRVRYDT